jgi:hypothetical protein
MAKVGTSNSDRTISLRLQCVVKKHKHVYPLDKGLDSLQSWSRHFGEEESFLSLPGIESEFPVFIP